MSSSQATEESKELFYLSDVSQLVVAGKTAEGAYKLNTSDNLPTDKATPQVNSRELDLANDLVFVVDSIKAGSGSTGKESAIFAKLVKPILSDILHIDHHHVTTTSRTSIQEFGENFQKAIHGNSRPVTVIFISGDTSVSEFINSLSSEVLSTSTSLKLFVIPAGTGNSLALSVGISDVLDSITKLVSYNSGANVHPLYNYEVSLPPGSYFSSQNAKVAEITRPYRFLVVFSWGFHASLVADSDTPEFRKRGIERFKLAAISNLSEDQIYKGEATIGGADKQVKGPFAYFVVTAAQRFEPTFVISPQGNILDNSLYLVSFNSEPNEKDGNAYIMEVAQQVYDSGAHVKNERVTYEKIEPGQDITLRIDQNDERRRRFCLDGSLVVLPDVKDQNIVIKHRGNEIGSFKLYIID